MFVSAVHCCCFYAISRGCIPARCTAVCAYTPRNSPGTGIPSRRRPTSQRPVPHHRRKQITFPLQNSVHGIFLPQCLTLLPIPMQTSYTHIPAHHPHSEYSLILYAYKPFKHYFTDHWTPEGAQNHSLCLQINILGPRHERVRGPLPAEHMEPSRARPQLPEDVRVWSHD